jgi:hypothetical protein
MGIVMLHTFILGSYRLFALILLALPVVLNFIYRGDVIISLVYVPSAMLVLGCLVTYIDSKVETYLTQIQNVVLIDKAENKPANSQYHCMLYKHLRHVSIH